MPSHWLIRISKNFVPIERSKLRSWSINFSFRWFASLLAYRWSFRTTWLNRWWLSKSWFRTSGWSRRRRRSFRWQRWWRWRHWFRSITWGIVPWYFSSHLWRSCGISRSFKPACKAVTCAGSRFGRSMPTPLIIIVKWVGRIASIGRWTCEQSVLCYCTNNNPLKAEKGILPYQV